VVKTTNTMKKQIKKLLKLDKKIFDLKNSTETGFYRIASDKRLNKSKTAYRIKLLRIHSKIEKNGAELFIINFINSKPCKCNYIDKVCFQAVRKNEILSFFDDYFLYELNGWEVEVMCKINMGTIEDYAPQFKHAYQEWNEPK
jgi:hypothetical protein